MPRKPKQPLCLTVISSVGNDEQPLISAIGRTLEILAEEKRKKQASQVSGNHREAGM